jgi:hypothetical protein
MYFYLFIYFFRFLLHFVLDVRTAIDLLEKLQKSKLSAEARCSSPFDLWIMKKTAVKPLVRPSLNFSINRGLDIPLCQRYPSVVNLEEC